MKKALNKIKSLFPFGLTGIDYLLFFITLTVSGLIFRTLL